MKLVAVEFSKFKSIVDESLDIEKDVTCLVGINEAGKSNVLNALLKVDTSEDLSEDDFSRHDSNFGDEGNSPELKIHLVPANPTEQQELDSIFGHKVDLVILAKSKGGYRLCYPAIEHEKSSFYSAPEPEEELEESQDTAQDSATTKKPAEGVSDLQKQEVRKQVFAKVRDEHIPNFVFFDSVNFDDFYLPENGEVTISTFVADPDAELPIKNMLLLGGIDKSNYQRLSATTEAERIRRDKLLGDVSEEINKKIFQVAWPIKTVGVKLGAEGDILKIRLHEEGKTSPFTPGERSRGLQWALAFNIHFLASVQGDLQDSVLLIDEPGIFLHVDAQKYLLEHTFHQIVGGGSQIVYTTHLPYLINSVYPERIRILEKLKEDTKIGNKAWSEGEFGLLPEPVKTALGLQWSEILHIGDNNLLVEGASDQIILREMYKSKGEEVPSIIPVYGKGKMASCLALVKVEEKFGKGIVDSDANLVELRKKLGFVAIEGESVEHLHAIIGDITFESIEDVIPEELYKKAVLRVYGKKLNKLTLEEITAERPRVKKTQEFFATKFRAKKHTLLKMEIARALRHIIEEEEAATHNWTEAEKIIEWFKAEEVKDVTEPE